MLGRTDLHSEIFLLGFFRIPDSWIPEGPGSWIPDAHIFRFKPEIAGARLRDGSAVAPDHKVGEIQGARTIP